MTETSGRDIVSAAQAVSSGWVHFALAAGVLLVAAVGWNTAMSWLKWTMAKEPVPPPAAVEVREHRLVNFPREIGPYLLADDGELTTVPDGRPDGLREVRDDILETLGVEAHEMNWYHMAVYRDTRVEGAYNTGGGQYVQLDITYYTGLLDAVPHVGERCIIAGGGIIVPGASKSMSVSVPSAAPPWDRFDIYRTAYEFSDRRGGPSRRSAQYHVFSMNGRPTERWERVRGELTLPWVKYCYYAKIQWATLRPEPDFAKNDAVCRDFISYALPVVLRFLPTTDDIEKLKASGGR